MIPTNSEVAGWIILLIIAIIFLVKTAMKSESSSEIEITWGQRRDWENRARDYERRTR